MKGYRFYADYDDAKHRRRDTIGSRSQRTETPAPAKNVIAVYLDETTGQPLFNGRSFDCACSVYEGSVNGPVASSGVSPSYLQERCRRVSEAEARRIHPQMFEYLAYEPA